MKKRMLVAALIVGGFVFGAVSHSQPAQGSGHVRIYRESTIIPGENPPILQIGGEIIGFSCAAEHDPKYTKDVECFVLVK